MIPRRRWRKEFSSSMDMYAFAGISSSPGALLRLSLRAAHASSSSVKGKSMISPSKFLASSNSTFVSPTPRLAILEKKSLTAASRFRFD